MLHAGTSVVIIMSQDELWVAADSNAILIGAEVTTAPTEYKIHELGNIFYTQAGLVKDLHGKWQPAAMANEIALRLVSFGDIVVEFERRIEAPLLSIADELRSINPEYYRTKILNKAAFSAAFFGIDARQLRLAVRRFSVHELPSNELTIVVERSDCPGDCPSGMTWAFLGETVAINRFLDQHPTFLADNGYRKTLQALIEVEATANPQNVGLPVDILRITQFGEQWIQRKPDNIR